MYRICRRRLTRADARTCVFLIVLVTLMLSCTGQESGEDLRLEGTVYGFVLGERKSELFGRAKGMVEWERIDTPRGDYRGELYRFSGTLIDSPEISHTRLAFFEDRLMEVIVYFKDTSVSRLRAVKQRLEDYYGAKAVSPGGTRETVYKTYRFYAPGISVTLRRFTKLTETELFIQFLHEELNGRLLERKRELKEQEKL
jgi:hypothetical protein